MTNEEDIMQNYTATDITYTLLKCYWKFSEEEGYWYMQHSTGNLHLCSNGRLWLRHPHGLTCVDRKH